MSELVLLGARLLDPVTGRLLRSTALAAAGGRISCLGDDREVRALADAGTTVIDAGGAVVMPGLTDGHMHPVSGAERTAGIDLSGCADLASVREALAGGIAALAPGAWLRGWGLDPNVFGAGAVTSDPFGPVLDGIPAAIDLFDGHSMLASPRALELAGIDGPRSFGQAAEVVCDSAGRPTGLLLEDAACALVEAVAPVSSFDERCSRAAQVLASMAAAGLTGGHAMDGEGLDVYAALEDSGSLPLRVRVAPWCQPGGTARAGLDREGPGRLRPAGPAPGGAHRDDPGRGGGPVRFARGGRVHAAHALLRLHPGRPHRQLVPAAGRGTGGPGLAVSRPAGIRGAGGPGLGLADRAVRAAGRDGPGRGTDGPAVTCPSRRTASIRR